MHWHTLADSTIKKLIKKHTTWGEIMKRYKQPNWCSYPDAIEGVMGCWSLIGASRDVISKEYCAKCDCFREAKHE